MRNEKNGLALAGFAVSVASVGLFAAGLLCLIGVMLTASMSFVFGGAAAAASATGIVLSGVGHYRSYEDGVGGAAFSLAGLLAGTVGLTLVLVMTALMIVAAVIA